MNFHKFREANFDKFLIIILSLAFLLPSFFLLAQMSPIEERQTLEAELRELEEQIVQHDKDIQKTEQEKKTLQNQIYILRNKIQKLDLQIQQSNIIINDLRLQIIDTEGSIEKTSLEIEKVKDRISTILRTIYEEDQRSLVEVLLSEGVSAFFENLVSLEAIGFKNQELLENIKNLKLSLEDQKQALDDEKEASEKQVLIQTLQKQESETARKEQEYFLKLTEAEYQKYLKEKEETQKKAQEIRSRIFELIGVPEAPTFGEAYEIAKFVSTQTGVKPALLLAVLTQESNIGKNVGQCFLTNSSTGEGVRLKTGEKTSRVMSPSRDVPYFLEITKELGRDPYNTPVSCPMSYGWGGAMGPAQFIPSTWVLYKDKVSAVTGRPADPWNIKDAFLAAGVYLKDLGVLNNEFNAVMKYFSGSSWSKWEEFYGHSVLAIATQYEADIKELEQAQ